MSEITQALATLIKQQGDAVQAWLASEFIQTPACFYSSVDLRHSGAKLVPVDTNLFPAGFNHLSTPSRAKAVELIKRFIARAEIPIQNVLIIPENHTRNIGYLDNLQALMSLFKQAGLCVRIGSLSAQAGEELELQDSDGELLVQKPLIKQGNIVRTDEGFEPDMIVVNNDMTSGSPDILKGVTQLIVPQIGLGWYRRKKSIHFDAYSQVADQFSRQFGLDSWRIAALHHKCGRIDFKERKGIDCVALGVEKLLHQLREKYAQYGIKQEPYVFIKSDSGTYGMGIMTARSGDEVVEMNKKIRNKMNTVKEGAQTTEVIIQEGVATIDEIDGGIAEPMIYLVDGTPVGGAYRVNRDRDIYNNLNAKGMSFVPLCENASKECLSGSPQGLIAQLATLAASREEYGDLYMI